MAGRGRALGWDLSIVYPLRDSTEQNRKSLQQTKGRGVNRTLDLAAAETDPADGVGEAAAAGLADVDARRKA
jgi:hypothetical protein